MRDNSAWIDDRRARYRAGKEAGPVTLLVQGVVGVTTLMCCLGMLAVMAVAGVRRVPSDYLTIQAGVDVAADGDTVLIAEGVYRGPGNRDVDLRGKQLTVMSEAGSGGTVIDCEEAGRGFLIHSSEPIALVSWV